MTNIQVVNSLLENGGISDGDVEHCRKLNKSIQKLRQKPVDWIADDTLRQRIESDLCELQRLLSLAIATHEENS